ncbi:MAG: DarT ssDNA thymidine ADP-ribosyltransferase family protein [Candidatus Eremiobacterota bacterium]
MRDERDKIRLECLTRGIEHLVHFTHLCNVPGILKSGMIPRAHLRKGQGVRFSDEQRWDGELEANCLTIQVPNERMFYKKCKEKRDWHWAVLLLDPSILWETMCLFCRENAASKLETQARRLQKTPRYGSVDDFRSMFRGDRDREPANDQAEVLVYDTIHPRKIRRICLALDEDRETVLQDCPPEWERHLVVEPRWFPENHPGVGDPRGRPALLVPGAQTAVDPVPTRGGASLWRSALSSFQRRITRTWKWFRSHFSGTPDSPERRR